MYCLHGSFEVKLLVVTRDMIKGLRCVSSYMSYHKRVVSNRQVEPLRGRLLLVELEPYTVGSPGLMPREPLTTMVTQRALCSPPGGHQSLNSGPPPGLIRGGGGTQVLNWIFTGKLSNERKWCKQPKFRRGQLL